MKSKSADLSSARGREAGRRPQADLSRTEWQKFAAAGPRAARSLGVFRR